MSKMRVVVCAANRYGDQLILGARHYDKAMHDQIVRLGWDRSKSAYCHGDDQGFIDQFGVYMTRAEAWTVAKEAGQIRQRVGGDEGCLYSENLY